jgi:sulfite dehydrogenase (cytochrome) subunit B
MRRALACVLFIFLLAPWAWESQTLSALEGQEKTISLPNDNAMSTLKPGPGVETTRNNCSICHSTDYIVRQPGADVKRWRAEVQKMITVYGAPIGESDAQVIAEYLASAYGPAPAPNGKKRASGKP